MLGIYKFAAKRILLVCIIYCASASGQTQSSKLVELTYDDGSGIVGELIEFADGKYRLETSVGVITVPEDGVLCKGAQCPKKHVAPVSGKTIKLTSLDGAAVVTGELLEVTDGKYVVSTSVGVVKIPVDLVICEGDGCL